MNDSYQLLDFGDEARLEQWAGYRLIRPDPTATGMPKDRAQWQNADAVYHGEKGKGEWEKEETLPDHWPVTFDDLRLRVMLAPYKHTGVFPEQLRNWRWMRARGKEANRSLAILNLFAYTGGATVALAKDGHFVTHVDASKPTIGWAKENQTINGIPADRIRWILDDAAEFAAREVKRGKKYNAILLDPPAFGHSPSGKTWRVERDLKPLLEKCAFLLSDEPAFLLLNGYAKGDTPDSFHRLLTGILHTKRPDLAITVTSDELSLITHDGRNLSTGIVARCSFV